MKLHIIFGQRHEGYFGQLPPEALEIVSEFDNEENSSWLEEKFAEYKKNKNYESVAIVIVNVGLEEVLNAFRPVVEISGEIVKEKT